MAGYCFHIENSRYNKWFPYFIVRLYSESDQMGCSMNIWYTNERTGTVTLSIAVVQVIKDKELDQDNGGEFRNNKLFIDI